MEFMAAFVITIIGGIIYKSIRKHGQKTDLSNRSIADKTKASDEHERKLQEADELITVILPTINHDK